MNKNQPNSVLCSFRHCLTPLIAIFSCCPWISIYTKVFIQVTFFSQGHYTFSWVTLAPCLLGPECGYSSRNKEWGQRWVLGSCLAVASGQATQGSLKAQNRRMAVCVVGAIAMGIERSLNGQEDSAESRNPKSCRDFLPSHVLIFFREEQTSWRSLQMANCREEWN